MRAGDGAVQEMGCHKEPAPPVWHRASKAEWDLTHSQRPGSMPEDTGDRKGDASQCAILKQNTVALGLVGKSKHSIGKQAEVLSSHSELCPGSASAPERLQGKMSSDINLLMGERSVSVRYPGLAPRLLSLPMELAGGPDSFARV